MKLAMGSSHVPDRRADASKRTPHFSLSATSALKTNQPLVLVEVWRCAAEIRGETTHVSVKAMVARRFTKEDVGRQMAEVRWQMAEVRWQMALLPGRARVQSRACTEAIHDPEARTPGSHTVVE